MLSNTTALRKMPLSEGTVMVNLNRTVYQTGMDGYFEGFVTRAREIAIASRTHTLWDTGSVHHQPFVSSSQHCKLGHCLQYKNQLDPRLLHYMADRVITDRMVADHRLSQISTASSTNSKRAKAHVGPWQLGRTLGRGSSGRVRLAKHTETGKLAAVKIVPKAQTQDPASSTQKTSESYGIEREVIIMKLIEHPNIMGLFDVWENKGELYLVLEYIEGGELFDYLISRGRLSEREAIHYFRQICYGVDYCHRFNICHRDLKPENLLLDKHRNIKIADFGMAALEANGRLLETSCGSPHYASPEIVSGKTYHGAPSDIWSCGIILFALLTGHLPFDDDNIRQLLLKVQAGKFTIPISLSAEARDLISRMLVVNPMERICMRDILEHPLLLKYPPRHVPAENMEKKMPKLDVSQRISHIDREILRNLQTLWPHTPRDTLVAQLRKPNPNTEKIFYALLVRFRQRHGLSSRDSIPRNKSVASIKSMRSSKSVRSLASLNSKPGSMKSLKSVRSNRSARSIMSARRRRSPTKQIATASGAKSTNNSQRASLNEHADMFAQILDQAFNPHLNADPRVPAARTQTTARPAKVQNHASNFSHRNPEGTASYTSNANNSMIYPRKNTTTSAVPTTSATYTISRSSAPDHNQATPSNAAFTRHEPHVSLHKQVPSGNKLPETSRFTHSVGTAEPSKNYDAFDALNVDFDFSNNNFGLPTENEQNYLLPMIFEEDRFADAIEEEMEQKVYKRNLPSFSGRGGSLRNQAGDDSQLRINNLATGESFLSYHPSPAAVAISAPVRPAPKAPGGPRSMPHRKPVPIYSDNPPEHRTFDSDDTARVPLAPLDEEESPNVLDNNDQPHTRNAHSTALSGPVVVKETAVHSKDTAGPLKVQKREDRAKVASDEPLSPKEKNKVSWIRRLTPKIVLRKSSDPDKQETEPKKPSHSPTEPAQKPVKFGASVDVPITKGRVHRPAETVVDKENLYAHRQASTPFSVKNDRAWSDTRRKPPSSAVEEPRQNWFMKVLSSSAQSSTHTLRASCQSIELRAIILEILNEWIPYGLAMYNDGARGDAIVVAILRNNTLRLKAARIGINIRPSSPSMSSAKLVLQKGSRTSFTAFANEMTRRLRENNIMGTDS